MRHEFLDLKDPKVRKKHFQTREGQPSHNLLVLMIGKKATELYERDGPGAEYESAELCEEIWATYLNQHVYIGHQIPKLIEQKRVPLKRVRVDDGNNHVFYEIVSP